MAKLCQFIFFSSFELNFIHQQQKKITVWGPLLDIKLTRRHGRPPVLRSPQHVSIILHFEMMNILFHIYIN